MNAIRQMVIALLDDDEGVGDKGFCMLQALFREGNEDIFDAVEGENGRVYLPTDFVAERNVGDTTSSCAWTRILEAAKTVTQYVISTEEDDYEDYIADDGDPSAHVFSSAVELAMLVETVTLGVTSAEKAKLTMHDLHVGAEVFWNDPDCGISSGIYVVTALLENGILRLRNSAGAETEATIAEVS